MASELTLERIAELEALESKARGGGVREALRLRDEVYSECPALLAMAKAHLELVSALEFLNAKNFDGHGWHPERIVDLARRVGWQSPITTKGGSENG